MNKLWFIAAVVLLQLAHICYGGCIRRKRETNKLGDRWLVIKKMICDRYDRFYVLARMSNGRYGLWMRCGRLGGAKFSSSDLNTMTCKNMVLRGMTSDEIKNAVKNLFPKGNYRSFGGYSPGMGAMNAWF